MGLDVRFSEHSVWYTGLFSDFYGGREVAPLKQVEEGAACVVFCAQERLWQRAQVRAFCELRSDG